MKKFINKIFSTLRKSILDKFGKESSVRISGFIVLFSITLFALIFATIELGNAILLWKKGQIYVISAQIILILTSYLAHHLGILFNKRKEYKENESIDKMPSITDVNNNISKVEGSEQK